MSFGRWAIRRPLISPSNWGGALISFFSVQPPCSLRLCGGFLLQLLTTETQRTGKVFQIRSLVRQAKLGVSGEVKVLVE